MQTKRKAADKTPLYQSLGGTSAENLKKQKRSRPDGKSLSRTLQLICGSKSDFLLVADSGPGETDTKGLIVPKFGNKPENHVAVSMSFQSLSELFLLTKTHYIAWLSAWYGNWTNNKMSSQDTSCSASYPTENHSESPNISMPLF